MEFLLIAPLDRAIPDESENAGTRLSGSILRSRGSFEARELKQRQRPIEVSLPPDSAMSESVEVIQCHLVSIGSKSLLVLTVKLSESSAPTDVEAIEILLSDTVSELTANSSAFQGATPLWVSRTIVLRDDEEVPKGWLGASKSIELGNAGNAVNAGQRVSVGWGNNAIEGWTEGPFPVQSPLVDGLVDAQYLWADIDELASNSSDVVHDVLDSDQSARSQFLADLRIMERLTSNLANHNLAYDDLLLHIQGHRRSVATSALKVWGYRDIHSRISRRLDETTRLIEQRKARQDRRYQGVVESILFGLALVALIGLVFDAIVAAHEEHAGGIHRDASPIGILQWVIETDPDWLLIGVGLLIVAAVGILVAVRARRK